MKTLIACLIALLPAMALMAAPPNRLLVAFAPELSEQYRECAAHSVGELMYQAEPGTEISVVRADPLSTVVSMKVPDGSIALRQQRASAAIRTVMQGFRAATNGADSFSVPATLDAVARQFGSGNATLLLIGPSLAGGGGINFKQQWPSDGYLVVGPDRSPFSTTERSRLLDALRVYWIVTDSGKSFNSRHTEAVRRFWSLYISCQRGALANYSPDFPSTFNNAVHGDWAAPTFEVPDSRDSELKMHSALPEPFVPVKPTPPTPPVVVTNYLTETNVISITNIYPVLERSVLPSVADGNTGIGIVWSGDVDLDLHLVGPRDGVELYFGNPNSKAGHYYRDIRRGTPSAANDWRASWEFIELYGDQIPAEAWLDLYSGRGPVQGELRIQYRGRIHRVAFTFPAVRGDGGADSLRRSRSEHWLRIDLQSVVQP